MKNILAYGDGSDYLCTLLLDAHGQGSEEQQVAYVDEPARYIQCLRTAGEYYRNMRPSKDEKEHGIF